MPTVTAGIIVAATRMLKKPARSSLWSPQTLAILPTDFFSHITVLVATPNNRENA